MAVTVLAVVMVAAVFVSMVLLAFVCLHCRNKGPLVHIRQANASEESTEFRVIHPSGPTVEQNSIHAPSHLLSPFSSSADPGTQRRHQSFTPTETESNPSYENPTDGPDYINTESDAEDPGYIIVLPEDEALTNQSRTSTPSSDVQHDYENVPEKKESAPASVLIDPNQESADGDEEDREYLNVDPLHFQRSTQELSAQSDSDSDDDDDDDDDDDAGNYVNLHDGTD